MQKRERHAAAVCTFLQTPHFCCSVVSTFSHIEKGASGSPLFDVRKRYRHACTVCTLLQKWPNGCNVAVPFSTMYKRGHHAAAVWLFSQTPFFCSSVASLFGTSEKRGVTLQRKLRVCKSEQTIRAWRSLFQLCIKGMTTLQRFGYFCKPYFFAAAWRPFLGQRKKGVSRCSEN